MVSCTGERAPAEKWYRRSGGLCPIAAALTAAITAATRGSYPSKARGAGHSPSERELDQGQLQLEGLDVRGQ